MIYDKQTPISDIAELETKKKWHEAYQSYVIGYEKHSNDYDFNLRYCFFCWYLISQWEQIEFKDNPDLGKRIASDVIDGLSKSELFNKVKTLSEQITNIHWNENNYVNNAIFCHMVIAFPYVFCELNLNANVYVEKLKETYNKCSDNPIIKALYYRATERDYVLGSSEKEIISTTFSGGSLMSVYFSWYIILP